MTSFLDMSVLVPVFLADHPHHAASIALLSTCEPETASCAGHSLAEVSSTLTRIPAPHRASPEQAIQCVEEIAARLRLISLDGAATLAAIQNAASRDIAGGAIHDSLIATCALQSKPDRIYSWNTRHFERLGLDVALRLTTP
ncbi:MAG: twitching motility protein PilT [Acidobacteriota bacterium]